MSESVPEVQRRLQESVLPLFRSRAELFRWRAVGEYARAAQQGVLELRQAADEVGAGPVIPYVQKAISSMVRVILRADDSGGGIGTLIRMLLDLHAELCAVDPPPPAKLVRWLIRFQFDGAQDFFEPDVARYAAALGPSGLARYRTELATIAEQTPPEPNEEERMASFAARYADPKRSEDEARHGHNRFLLNFNAQRLAVADRDVAQIIDLYGSGKNRPYQLHEVAKALAEIDEYDLAIEFAERGTMVDAHHWSQQAGLYWCDLLAEHRPSEELAARRRVFERWSSFNNATRLYRAAGDHWPELEEDVLARLTVRGYDYIFFLLLTLEDVPQAWSEAYRIELDSDPVWTQLVDAYTEIDPPAVMPVLRRLIESDLLVTGVRNYRSAIRRLKKLRGIAAGLGRTNEVDVLIAELRQTNRARTRFLRELDKAGL